MSPLCILRLRVAAKAINSLVVVMLVLGEVMLLWDR